MDWKNKVDKSWALFLDRDGVINVRIIDDYVKNINEFDFLSGVLDAMKVFAEKFGKVIVVTNQQGVGKGLMTLQDVNMIHNFMKKKIADKQGRVDAIYVCPQLKSDPDNFRKPNPRMAYMAQRDFPEINLNKSIMIGDSNSDMEFGRNAGMYTISIGDEVPKTSSHDNFNSLLDFAKSLK